MLGVKRLKFARTDLAQRGMEARTCFHGNVNPVLVDPDILTYRDYELVVLPPR